MNSFYWALAASAVWGIVPILEKIGLSKVNPLTGLFYRCTGVLAGMVVLAIFILKPQEIKNIDLKSGLFLIVSGFLASFAAQIFFYNALRYGEVSKIVPISGSYPLLAFVLGVFLLNEPINLPKIAGCLFVIAGIWLLK